MWKFIISTAYGYLAVVWIICTLCRLGQISTLNVQSNNHNLDSESMWRNVSRSVCGGCSWQWRCPWHSRLAVQQRVLSTSHLGLAAAWFYRYTSWAVQLLWGGHHIVVGCKFGTFTPVVGRGRVGLLPGTFRAGGEGEKWAGNKEFA